MFLLLKKKTQTSQIFEPAPAGDLDLWDGTQAVYTRCWSPLKGDIPNKYPLYKVVALITKGTHPKGFPTIFPMTK